MTHMRLAWLMGIALLATGPAWSSGAASGEDKLSGEVVTGTLMKLDLTARTGLVQTDLGRPIFFEVTKPQLFEHLSIGGRVTLELDSQGAANKIIDASIAEFLLPPPEERLPDALSVS